MIRALIENFRHCRDGYDLRGNVTFLSGRDPEPDALQIPGVPAATCEQTLKLLCNAFEIPLRQMHCLRLGDELMEIYRSFNGQRKWDRFEFESLWLALAELPAGKVESQDFHRLRTVEDVIRFSFARALAKNSGSATSP